MTKNLYYIIFISYIYKKCLLLLISLNGILINYFLISNGKIVQLKHLRTKSKCVEFLCLTVVWYPTREYCSHMETAAYMYYKGHNVSD